MNEIRTCKIRTDLALIKEPGTELVIWQRSLPSCFQAWINQTNAINLPNVRILIKPNELRSTFEPLLDSCGLMAGEMRKILVADINDLVFAFADITRSSYVDIRLEPVSDDACWKFHRDSVETRLLTTYRGPTTEWVRQEYAMKAIQEQREFKGPLERLKDGDVAIFKGSCIRPNRGIVHRSPPIASSGLTRLLLCLNQRSASSPDPLTEARKQ